jgi:peptidyl-prolyl cis-trans isomerase SurA
MKVFKENEAGFLESMVDVKLQIQAAKKLDIDASSEEIAEAIDGIKKKYSISEKDFDESLKKEGFSLEEYRKLLAEQIILSKVVNQQVKSKIVVSDREITEYVAKNRGGGYKIRQIFFRKPEKETDRKDIEAKAEDVYRRLMAGEDFVSLAVKYSDDPSGKTGGELGFVKKEQLGKEFLDVLTRMNTGEVSRPFWTSPGLHIIQLEDKEDAKSPEESREIAKKKLSEKRFNEEYKNWIKGLREKSFVEIRL